MSNGVTNNMGQRAHRKPYQHIHEVKETQPRSVCCRNVANKARGVRLIYSIDQKLGWKGGARKHSQQLWDAHSPRNLLEVHRKFTSNVTSTTQPGRQ